MIEKNSLWDFILSKNHILPSPTANKMGVPILRTILGNLGIILRRYKNCRPITSYEKDLIKNGIVIIPNFLPDEEFQKLKKEFLEIISKTDVEKANSGSTKFTFKYLKKEEFNNYEMIKNFSKNEQLIRLICAAEGLKLFKELGTLIFEKTDFGKPLEDTDPNKLFHADVHFHSHKVLYYIDDVTNDNGPFAYCRGSHRNNLDRLYFEFKRGQLEDACKNSWRINDHQEKKFFKDYFSKLMNNKEDVIGKANTLIITNVHGFHRRGDATEGTSRSLIRIPFRYNPIGNSKKVSHDSYSGKLF